jgi:hypothetical protein
VLVGLLLRPHLFSRCKQVPAYWGTIVCRALFSTTGECSLAGVGEMEIMEHFIFPHYYVVASVVDKCDIHMHIDTQTILALKLFIQKNILMLKWVHLCSDITLMADWMITQV